MPHQSDGVPFAFGPHIPDVFADELVSFETINGVVRLSFGVAKMVDPVPPSPTQMVVIGRLLIPVAGAQRLALGLYDYLKSQGHDPSAAVGAEPGKKAN